MLSLFIFCVIFVLPDQNNLTSNQGCELELELELEDLGNFGRTRTRTRKIKISELELELELEKNLWISSLFNE